jgi:uncharacterized protein YecT (DUF1311 family)
MWRAYEDLRRSARRTPDALARLGSAQRAWQHYRDAHEEERFPTPPDVDNPMYYYGSVLPMCLAYERESTTELRTSHLRGTLKCMGHPVSDSAQVTVAEAELNRAYDEVRRSYANEASAKETRFLAALQQAEAAWETYRDANTEFVHAVAGVACADQARESLVQERTRVLRTWLKLDEEGDVCAGSYRVEPQR